MQIFTFTNSFSTFLNTFKFFSFPIFFYTVFLSIITCSPYLFISMVPEKNYDFFSLYNSSELPSQRSFYVHVVNENLFGTRFTNFFVNFHAFLHYLSDITIYLLTFLISHLIFGLNYFTIFSFNSKIHYLRVLNLLTEF